MLVGLAIAIAAAACAFDGRGSDPRVDEPDPPPPADKVDDNSHGLSPSEARGVLELANSASLTELDDEVELDARAAANIVVYRDGPDKELDTDDDNRFDDIAELDSIEFVGEAAFAKLLAYAYEEGYIEGHGAAGCILISEYVEGQGNYNKAIEILNCGSLAVELGQYHVCLVRNDDTSCTLTAPIDNTILPPGEVRTLCRSLEGTFADPMDAIRERCDIERPGVMTFNGDDRLVIAHNDGAIADVLGVIDLRPAATTWQDVVLRRCRIEPFDGQASGYDHLEYFTEHARTALDHFGQPPVESCE